MGLQWGDVRADFNRKQGYGNAEKVRKKRSESTEEFIQRCVEMFEAGKKNYNPEGWWGDMVKKYKENHILVRAFIMFMLFSVVGYIGFIVIDYIYLYLECWSLFTIPPICSMLDKMRFMVRNNFVTFQYMITAQVLMAVASLLSWVMNKF
eukprot:SAG31_NODE_3882_length_3789_cov_1.497561_4_plen_150_part_00